MGHRMKLTQQQREAVLYEMDLSLVSCPGSGKTHTIVARLLRCLDDVRDTTRFVGCITYTNAAVNEIQYRLSTCLGRDEFEDKIDVGTIHSFCLNNIFRPNHWRLETFQQGFSILTPDDEEYQEFIGEIIRDHSLDPRAFDQFELLFKGRAMPYYITAAAAESYWNYLDSHKYVDFNGIIYYAAQLVTQFTFIPGGLAARFAWLLVDEFQDTSEFQVQILNLIASYGRTRFFIVGDPGQSIMSFAGGRPELMREFASIISAKNDLTLSGNFRSSSNIVNLAETLQPRIPRMDAVGDNKDYDFTPLWIESHDTFSGIADHFLPEIQEQGIDYGEVAILAPNFYILCGIASRLRDMGIPLMGPGARPYKKSSHLIAPLAEVTCSHIESEDSRIIRTIKRRIQEIIECCESRWNPRLFGFLGDLATAEIIRLAEKLKDKDPIVKKFLNKFAAGTADILIRRELLADSSRHFLIESSRTMINDIENHSGSSSVDVDSFSVSELGLFARGDRSIKLLTLHKAKGREFDAVAIIKAQDGLIPYGDPPAGSDLEAEAKRLLYVGITRARKLLMLFTDALDIKPPSRFLSIIFPDGPMST